MSHRATDDSACVQRVVDSYTGQGNILICWEHKALTNLVLALGATSAPTYPSSRYVPSRLILVKRIIADHAKLQHHLERSLRLLQRRDIHGQ